MNIALWVLQIVLAVWEIVGALSLAGHYREYASTAALNALPPAAWIVLALLQVLFALGLVLPGVFKRFQGLISISAACLAVISLLGIGLYAQYAGFPGMLWGVIPAIVAAFVAYERMPRNAGPAQTRASAAG